MATHVAQAAQDNSAIALDWITGILALVTAVMAGATVVLGIKTAASVKVAKEAVLVAKEEADATLELARGAREDRELAVRPILYSKGDTLADVTPEIKAVPVIVVRNIGRGPAIRTRVIRWYGGKWRYTPGWGEALAAAETYPLQPEAEITPNGTYRHPFTGSSPVAGTPRRCPVYRQATVSRVTCGATASTNSGTRCASIYVQAIRRRFRVTTAHPQTGLG